MKCFMPIAISAAVFAACRDDSEGRSKLAIAQVEVIRVIEGETHRTFTQLRYDVSGAWRHFETLEDNMAFASGRLDYVGGRLTRVSSLRFGATSTQTYHYDGDRLVEIEVESSIDAPRVTKLEYDDAGRLTRITGRGDFRYFYDSEGKLERFETRSVPDAPTAERTFTVKHGDDQERPARIEICCPDASAEYKYDDDGAVVKETGPSNIWTLIYNEEGNISVIDRMASNGFRQITTIRYLNFEVVGLTFAPDFDFGALFDLKGKYAAPDPLAIVVGDSVDLP